MRPYNADQPGTRSPAESRPPGGPEEPSATLPIARASSAPTDSATSPSTRYRTVRLHARGGLGEVFVAEDVELHRQVALKRIQERYCAEERSRKRFLLEAELTGRLEHPGVVPVYGLVCDASGTPSYAMRFIEGASLLEAIERFHKAEGHYRDPGERRLALRDLLDNLVAVCNAVAYAHSRGVIHRDLKPSNVMLGRFGETLVVDWGLARTIERDEASRASGVDTLDPVGVGGEATRLGQAIGTPAYMSPEQAAGRHDIVGVASDIYGLGATLYHLLTGKPPFQGGDIREIMQRVQRSDFPRPRLANSSVPSALEAICLKAMAFDPAKRYATAGALAADVKAWLGDEPIAAYRAPISERLRRWGRRHRTILASGLTMLVATVVALMVLLAQSNSARRELEQQQARTRKAEESARGAANRYFTIVNEDPDLKALGHEGLRRKLLAVGKEYAEEFLREHGDDPKLREELAAAHFRLAEITSQLGDPQAAIDEHLKALNLREGLSGTRDAMKRDIASGRLDLGVLYLDSNQFAESEAATRQALELFEELAAANPDDPVRQRDVASACNNLGTLYQSMRRFADAESLHRKALAIRQKLVAAHPDVAEYRDHLGYSHNNLGNLFREMGRLDEAGPALEAAREIWLEQVKARPTVLVHSENLGRVIGNLARYHEAAGRVAEAEAARREEVGVYRQLVSLHPDVRRHRLDLAAALVNLGARCDDGGRRKEAEALYRESEALFEKALARPSGPPQAHSARGALFHNLGNLLRGTGRRDEAAAYFQRAATEHERVAEGFPNETRHLRNALGSLSEFAGMLDRSTKRDEAETAYRRAVEIADRLVRSDPTSLVFQDDRGAALGNLGGFLLDTGRPEAALDALVQSAAALEPLPWEGSKHSHTLRHLLNTYRFRARALDRLKRPAEALKTWDRMLELAPPEGRAPFRLERALALVGTGRATEAVAEAEAVLKDPTLPAPAYYNAACIYARAAAANTETAEVDRLAARAVALLADAASKGLSGLDKAMANDPELEPLRGRADFRNLRKKVENPASERK